MKNLICNRCQRGFTLVEVLTALAVVTVLACVATPSLQGWLDTRRLDGAATQLATDIQYARSEAVARNQALRMTFHTHAQGSCYAIHPSSAPQPATCIRNPAALKTVLFNAVDRVSLAANVSSVLFDPLHGTSTPTATLRINSTGALKAVHHVINVMGRVRSCSPQGAMQGYRAC